MNIGLCFTQIWSAAPVQALVVHRSQSEAVCNGTKPLQSWVRSVERLSDAERRNTTKDKHLTQDHGFYVLKNYLVNLTKAVKPRFLMDWFERKRLSLHTSFS